jgi:hypothetical protein
MAPLISQWICDSIDQLHVHALDALLPGEIQHCCLHTVQILGILTYQNIIDKRKNE